jgi:hypothetical protein
MNRSTYTCDGCKVHGPAPAPIDTFPVVRAGERLIISMA